MVSSLVIFSQIDFNSMKDTMFVVQQILACENVANELCYESVNTS